jgi:hypothetical protein
MLQDLLHGRSKNNSSSNSTVNSDKEMQVHGMPQQSDYDKGSEKDMKKKHQGNLVMIMVTMKALLD